MSSHPFGGSSDPGSILGVRGARFRADDPGVLADALFLGVRFGVLGALALADGDLAGEDLVLAFLAGDGLATLSVSVPLFASSFLDAERVLFLPVLVLVLVLVLVAPLSSPAPAAAASEDDAGLNAKAEKSGRGRPDPFILLLLFSPLL